MQFIAKRFAWFGFCLVGLFMLNGPAWCSGAPGEEFGGAPDLDQEIGIIGAGPGGLVAAGELQKKGYRRVTLLEAGSMPGGKVLSHVHEGKVYELGAVVSSPDYDREFEIAKKLGIKVVDTMQGVELTPEGKTVSYWDRIKESGGMIEVGYSFNAFRTFVNTHPQVFSPGFNSLPAVLHNTFEHAAAKLEIDIVSDLYRPVMVGCGYGYLESMPAPYIIKLMKTFAVDSFKYALNPLNRRNFYKQFEGGWQNLWRGYALDRGFNIETNASVRRIERTAAPAATAARATVNIVIEKNGTPVSRRFDKVIVTVPHMIDRMMELNAEEKEIFSHVETIPYKVTLLAIDNLPRGRHVWVREHSTRAGSDGRPNDGNVVLLSNPHASNNLYIAYQFTETGKNSDQLREILRANVRQMGGRVGEIVVERTFDYFPHFSVQGFRRGAHERFNALQGQGGIYYTGALANFETVKFAGDHAAALIREHF